MPPVPMHPLETIERARELYEQGARVRDICAETQMTAIIRHLTPTPG